MEVKKTFAEINEKIRKGTAVVVTAEEVIEIVKQEGTKKAAKKIDVVTTGTFGIMCSSGAFLNFGHSKPKMKMSKVWLNDVSAYAGIAAVDAYIGATEVVEGDPLNIKHPGEFRYGGGHVIEDLVAGREVKFRATAYGTDCYPRTKFEKTITLNDLRDAFMFSPRNTYQNYNIGANTTDKTIYTYMGILQPNLGNITYSSAGQLSPLLNDPYFRTIGIGTRIFFGGGIGYVAWNGTQHDYDCERNAKGIPTGGAGTLSLVGDLKQMTPEYLRGASITGYGCSLCTGVGIPIPILDEEMLEFTAVSDADIEGYIIDYGTKYPAAEPGNLGKVTYAELKSGEVTVMGKKVPTAPLSSYPKAKKIANTLKEWIEAGKFELGEPTQLLPSPRNKE